MKSTTSLAVVLIALGVAAGHAQQQAPQDENQRFRFRSGVELINISATVTDANGRFVSGLRKEDFRVYQDDQPQEITHFNSERVPVSLGIVVDTSGSMAGDKLVAAKRALNRFLDLLGPDDEVFVYQFDSRPQLVQGWTSDKGRVRREIEDMTTGGGTALYDAVAEAIPLAQSGKHRKKALVVISDGNDMNSLTAVTDLQAQIRETEILVYAIGIDAQVDTSRPAHQRWTPTWRGIVGAVFQSKPVPRPFPRPGGTRPVPPPVNPGPTGKPAPPTNPGPKIPGLPVPNPPPVFVPKRNPSSSANSDRVNVAALRDITDNSGGRTEVVRDAGDLDPATAYIADELSKQYFLAYPAAGKKDGLWHAIRVEVRRGAYHVRARKGFVATP